MSPLEREEMSLVKEALRDTQRVAWSNMEALLALADEVRRLGGNPEAVIDAALALPEPDRAKLGVVRAER